MGDLAYRQLGQARENSTNAVSVYSPAADTETIVKTIVVANVTTTSETVRIFMDDDGTTYDQSTAIIYDVTVDANSTLQLDGEYCMDNASGNLAYRSSTANSLTITAFGMEKT